MYKNLALLLLLILSSTACSRIDEVKWQEEVQLHDGSTIVLSRQARRHSSGFPTAQRGVYIDESLHYKPLNLKWETQFTHSSVMLPISFDIIDGIPYLAVSFSNREWCKQQPPTRYLARFFKWQNGQWIELSQEEFPTGVALKNLYRRHWGNSKSQDAKGLITWKGGPPGLDYRTIKEEYETRKYFCKILERL